LEKSSFNLIDVLSQPLPEGTEERHDDNNYDDDDGDDDNDDDSDCYDNSDGSSLLSLQLYDIVGSCWFFLTLNLSQPSVDWPSKN
jgi:hypothetical protein